MERLKIALLGFALLAAGCGREATAVAPAERAALLREFREAEPRWQQGKVGTKLVALNDKSVVPPLLEMLGSQNRKTRCNAGRVLAGLGDDRGLFAVIRELSDKSHRPIRKDEVRGNGGQAPQVAGDRHYAAQVLREIGDQRAVPALIQALQDVSIIYQAAIVLGHLGDKRAIPPLRKMARDFPKERLWAGYGLAALGEGEGLSILSEVAMSDPLWTDRRHAVEALGEFGGSRATPILVKALKDTHVNVRVSAARALGRTRDPASLPALTEALNDAEVTKVHAPTTVASEARRAIAAMEAHRK